MVGVLQLPLLIDVLDQALPALNLGRKIRTHVGTLLVCFVSGFLCLALYYFFGVFLQYHGYAITDTRGFVLSCIAVWLWMGVSINYARACLCPPGSASVTSSSHPQKKEGAFFCKVCKIYKEPGTHHCRICNMCVLQMDHHCPFTGQCVGLKNYLSFYLFICYSLLGSLFAGSMTIEPWWECWARPIFTRDGVRLTGTELAKCEYLGWDGLIFLPVGSIVCCTGELWMFHTLMLLGKSSTLMAIKRMGQSGISLQSLGLT